MSQSIRYIKRYKFEEPCIRKLVKITKEYFFAQWGYETLKR